MNPRRSKILPKVIEKLKSPENIFLRYWKPLRDYVYKFWSAGNHYRAMKKNTQNCEHDFLMVQNIAIHGNAMNTFWWFPWIWSRYDTNFLQISLTSKCCNFLENYPFGKFRHALERPWAETFISGEFYGAGAPEMVVHFDKVTHSTPKSTCTSPTSITW